MSNLEKVAAELEQFDVKVSVATADVADLESVINAVEHIKSDLGSIDILNQQCRIAKFGGFLDLTPEEWEKHHPSKLDGSI